MKISGIYVAAVLALALMVQPADAALKTMGFKAITHRNSTYVAIGESQFSVEASDPCSSKIAFKFLNTGSSTSTIMDIYFDDHLHGNFSTSIAPVITNRANTQFVQGATPVTLPDALSASPAFVTTQVFNAQAKGQSLGKGINKSDYITITLTLASGKTWQNVSDDLASGALRVAVYGQNFNGAGTSAYESFVTVPEPATIAILGLGGLCLSRVRRKD